jgi:hypothetical protein
MVRLTNSGIGLSALDSIAQSGQAAIVEVLFLAIFDNGNS